MRIIRLIVLILVLIGAINWGLWGAFQYDVVLDIFGAKATTWTKLVYILIGLAGIYGISFIFSIGTCGFHHNCCDKDRQG